MVEHTQYAGTQPEATSQDTPTPRTPPTRQSGYGVLFALAIVAIGLIAYFKWQKSPVRPEPSSLKASVDYAALIQVHTDQASRRNVNALKVFEMDVDRVLTAHAPKFGSAAREAAKEAADYASCGKIIYYLAWDKVKKQSETEAYLNREIQPFVDPALQTLGQDVDAVVTKLEYELRRSTVQLANNLAARSASDAGPALTVDVEDMQRLDMQQSLRNLGFNAAGIGASVAFDAVAIGKSQLAAVLWKKMTSIAARMFGKQVVKVDRFGHRCGRRWTIARWGHPRSRGHPVDRIRHLCHAEAIRAGNHHVPGQPAHRSAAQRAQAGCRARNGAGAGVPEAPGRHRLTDSRADRQGEQLI